MVLDGDDWTAVRLSIIVSLTSVLVTLPLATLLAWVLARKQFPGKSLVDTLVNLPLVLPPVVTGYLLLVLLGRRGLLGGVMEEWLGVRFVFDWKGAVVAAGIVSLPLMVRQMRTAFAAIDVELIQIARTLGATPWDAFVTVSIPLAMPGILAGCLLGFARSLGEFGATIMVAGNVPGESQTISLQIYSQMSRPGGIEEAVGLVAVSIILAAVALWLGNWLERRLSDQGLGSPPARHGISQRMP